jgi:hypothetical protein
MRRGNGSYIDFGKSIKSDKLFKHGELSLIALIK